MLLILAVFRRSRWESEVPQSLRSLKDKLLEVLAHSKAPRTVQKYVNCFSRFENWCKSNQVPSLPCKPLHAALFLVHYSESVSSAQSVTGMSCAIDWAHRITGYIPPSGDPIMRETLAGTARLLARPVRRKQAISISGLRQIVRYLVSSTGTNLSQLRTATFCVLAFAGFLRSDEALGLRLNDIQFSAEHLTVKLRASKTDQFRQGELILIAKTGGPTCPYAITHRYVTALRTAAPLSNDSAYLFPRLSKSKTSNSLTPSPRYKITYSTMLQQVKEAALASGLSVNSLGLHSFRSGGASAAVAAGVPLELVQRHGRWRRYETQAKYLEETTARKLQTTIAMKL